MWPIEHLGGLALLQQQLFQLFSRCPYRDLEVVVFLLLLLWMMDFPLIDLLLTQLLKIFSYIGEDHSYYVLVLFQGTKTSISEEYFCGLCSQIFLDVLNTCIIVLVAWSQHSSIT